MSSETKAAPLSEAQSPGAAKRGFWSRIGDQFGLKLMREYLIPEETNNFLYSLGGILGILLALQFLTGFLLLIKYVPDAAVSL